MYRCIRCNIPVVTVILSEIPAAAALSVAILFCLSHKLSAFTDTVEYLDASRMAAAPVPLPRSMYLRFISASS